MDNLRRYLPPLSVLLLLLPVIYRWLSLNSCNVEWAKFLCGVIQP